MLKENILQRCREKGISAGELCERVGIHEKAIYRWDTISPSVATVAAIAKELETTIEELMKE